VTVAICSKCGHEQVLASRLAVDGDCEHCGAEEALVEEDAYDPEPAMLVCCDCGAELQGGLPGSHQHDEDYEGRFGVEDPCPFCATEDGAGELIPAEDASPAPIAPQTTVARAAATKLWERHGATVPVDVFAMARACGLEVRVGPFEHAGRLIDGHLIEVPQADLLVRQRFTVAHELGHATLAHQVPDRALEVEANAFASELLLPRHALREAVKSGLGFRQIAERFQASREATAYALKSARLIARVPK
jgi:IrrE N-terminal-like domain